MSAATRARRRNDFRKLTNYEDGVLRPPEGGWVPLSPDLMESPSWRAMSRAAHQVVDCLMVEHVRQGGQENGRLAVSYQRFVDYGIDKGVIKRTLGELDALGLVKTTASGRRAFGSAPGRVATYRLTFLGMIGDHKDAGPATNDWKRVSDEDAKALRKPKMAPPPRGRPKLTLVA